MNFDFDTLDKNIASAATDIIEEAEEEFWYSYSNKDSSKKEKVIYITKQELSDILCDFKQEIIREIIEPIKEDIDKIAKITNNLSENIKGLNDEVCDLNDEVCGLKTKVDKIYEPIIAKRKASAAARLNSDYYNKLEEEANNAIPEGDE